MGVSLTLDIDTIKSSRNVEVVVRTRKMKVILPFLVFAMVMFAAAIGAEENVEDEGMVSPIVEDVQPMPAEGLMGRGLAEDRRGRRRRRGRRGNGPKRRRG